ncbi:hypothetical protein BDR06DRAFT_302555 [Suillus hirtellus]|nr:hypothetical protein BDR06DRAFT_302555 [Suillus hirtellus]
MKNKQHLFESSLRTERGNNPISSPIQIPLVWCVSILWLCSRQLCSPSASIDIHPTREAACCVCREESKSWVSMSSQRG